MSRSLIRRLAGDESGVSAVEFALIAPVMLLFYAGMVDLCQGYMALKRTSHAASAVADLVSQSRTITKADINSIFEVGPAIMAAILFAVGLAFRGMALTQHGNLRIYRVNPDLTQSLVAWEMVANEPALVGGIENYINGVR